MDRGTFYRKPDKKRHQSKGGKKEGIKLYFNFIFLAPRPLLKERHIEK
jgi:hypothetical protein